MPSSETLWRMESWLLGLWGSIKVELANLASAWTLLQLLVIVVTFLFSVLVARLITPPLASLLCCVCLARVEYRISAADLPRQRQSKAKHHALTLPKANQRAIGEFCNTIRGITDMTRT
jgi:hypothetical protein